MLTEDIISEYTNYREMGKGPKHSNGKSRNNGIFRVAGQNFKTEKKGKAKEVTSKLKLVRSYIGGDFSVLILCPF